MVRPGVAGCQETRYNRGETKRVVRDEEAAMAAQRALHAIAPTVKEIAEALDVGESTVTSWRAGRRTPSAENLHKIAALADRRADELRGVAVELRRIASDEGES